jgi:pimeloyl-ACP methyl ester carboxylesterase
MQNNQSIFFRDSKIFYRVYGSGKAVVLIHGFGEDGSIWNSLAVYLKEYYLLIIPDLPGSGQSEMIKQKKSQTTIDDYAEVIIEILKKESVSKCTIIGHSMGGYITLAIADKFAEVLNGFGLCNSTAFADTEEKKKDRLKAIEFLRNNEPLTFLKTSIPNLFAENFKKEHANEIEQFIESVKYFSKQSLIEYLTAMMNRPERISVLQSTGLPVLFIIGEKDTAVPLEKSLAQCHLPDNSYVHILPEAGHMAMLEEKDQCREILQSFINDI